MVRVHALLWLVGLIGQTHTVIGGPGEKVSTDATGNPIAAHRRIARKIGILIAVNMAFIEGCQPGAPLALGFSFVPKAKETFTI